MPDIAMCHNITCSKRQTCYRFTATPSKYSQAYAGFKEDLADGGCEYYIKN
jgi:hypothetical protein